MKSAHSTFYSFVCVNTHGIGVFVSKEGDLYRMYPIKGKDPFPVRIQDRSIIETVKKTTAYENALARLDEFYKKPADSTR